ncbi:acetylglutamate kinase [Cesiribacter andamanensis]|uniref:Acetylglutamate kinase n=1 Tax=Cesiribacter andamanensis AMV16 TaxID=1279009 RepID=M7NB39_9BACT|nr:acetylglutamate kinase [Cesiribacter andamanensis]EMR04411.1 Acetylglutamate kinase [Cesiribacter andamanensis AMV16]
MKITEKDTTLTPLTIVKIGGNVVDNAQLLDQVLHQFIKLQGLKLLVHGGGKLATQLGEKLGLQAQMVGGRRLTDAAMLQVVTMVYGGEINKTIVALLQAAGCNALGLTGADGNLIPAHKRQKGALDWGFVGDFDPVSINTGLLQSLFAAGITPVVAPLTHDGQGSLLNTNADTIASGLAVALSPFYPTTLTYCFEKKGVLLDVEDEASVISRITPEDYSQYKVQGVIAEGMLPKLDNAFAALQAGVVQVRICHALDIAHPQTGTALCL